MVGARSVGTVPGLSAVFTPQGPWEGVRGGKGEKEAGRVCEARIGLPASTYPSMLSSRTFCFLVTRSLTVTVMPVQAMSRTVVF